jgi:hypothetical protein
MLKKEPLVINGQPVGRIRASFLLFKESWRYLRADSEMLWIPIITALLNLFLFGILVALFVITFVGGDITFPNENEPLSAIELGFLFACYVVGAFTLALTQAAITNTVYTRAHNGDATLGQSLKVAFSHWFPLLLWSLITSTVGLVIRMIAERSQLGAKIILMIVGAAWSVITYFTVTAIVLDKKSAFSAIAHSKNIFVKTWGETLISNVSLSLAFLVIFLLSFISGFGIIIFAISFGGDLIVVPILFVFLVWIVLLLLVNSALQGVLKTLLYIYASEGIMPPNFNQELLEKMLARSNKVAATDTKPPIQLAPPNFSA